MTTRERLADELAAAGEYTGDWETATIEDLAERVHILHEGTAIAYCTERGMATLCMTPAQAGRWNEAETTDQDCSSILCLVPTTEPTGTPSNWEGTLAETEDKYPQWYADCIENQSVYRK